MVVVERQGGQRVISEVLNTSHVALLNSAAQTTELFSEAVVACLLASRPSYLLVYLRDGPARTIVRLPHWDRNF